MACLWIYSCICMYRYIFSIETYNVKFNNIYYYFYYYMTVETSCYMGGSKHIEESETKICLRLPDDK